MSEPDDAAVADVFGTFAVLVAMIFTLSASTPKDRKSTRLNSSHLVTPYAVFCLQQLFRQELRRTPQPDPLQPASFPPQALLTPLHATPRRRHETDSADSDHIFHIDSPLFVRWSS